MCDWKIGSSPRLTAASDSASSGSTKLSSLSLGQWSVCRATLTGSSWPPRGRTRRSPASRPPCPWCAAPDQYAAPPVETWMMPSDPASAKPCRAAFRVWEEVTLTAGKAKPPALARSIMSAVDLRGCNGHADSLASDTDSKALPLGPSYRVAPWERLRVRPLRRFESPGAAAVAGSGRASVKPGYIRGPAFHLSGAATYAAVAAAVAVHPRSRRPPPPSHCGPGVPVAPTHGTPRGVARRGKLEP